MLDRNQMTYLCASLLLCTLIGLAAWLAPNKPSVLQSNINERAVYCSEYASKTEYDADGDATTTTKAEHKSCLPEKAAGAAPQSAQGRSLLLAEADLLAQEQMAFWTRFMAVFSALGLGALIWTLFEQRRLVATQSRAYLELVRGTIIFGVSGYFIVRVTVFNTGQTPANKIKFSGMMTFYPATDDQGRDVEKPFRFPIDCHIDFLAPAAVETMDAMEEYSFDRMKIDGLGNHKGEIISTEAQQMPRVKLEGQISFTDAFSQDRTTPVNLAAFFVTSTNEIYTLYGGTGRDVEQTGKT